MLVYIIYKNCFHIVVLVSTGYKFIGKVFMAISQLLTGYLQVVRTQIEPCNTVYLKINKKRNVKKKLFQSCNFDFNTKISFSYYSSKKKCSRIFYCLIQGITQSASTSKYFFEFLSLRIYLKNILQGI